ncbi:hypothetical protein E0H22_13725 [Rhodopseudomonas boonkerdii]|uniref:hypothetical protein n=1 Tax=Rhodopseudomonas boonkerdii TaxID=475937 RepID=UPI001E2E8532|nr:hypothetical protein [Rhodopseudomonas boonkerdii]UGV26650.1 hypothetical protein E0H22_13725 [Rhodopseudomonas boonkerdii]
MATTHTDRALRTDINSLPFISDDECLSRLAAAVQTHDRDRDADDHLDEVALLIGRLAVPIEI